MSQFFFLRSASAKALFCALAFAVPATHAAEHKFSLLLDTDNATATGCVVATADGSFSGVERVNTAVVTTTATTATVKRLEQQTCVGGALTAATTYDPGGWSAGLGNGTNGGAAIEFYVPLTSLPRGGTMKALAVSRNALGQQDATSAFLINVANAVVIPASLPVPLSTGLAALIALLVAVTVALRLRRPASSRLVTVLMTSIVISTLAWAATVTLDGNVSDWVGVSPAVTDASGDAPANADILAVYQQQDANNLYIRIDADVRLDAPVNVAPVVNAGPNQSITLPATASLTGSATDDGLPNPPATLTYAWTKVSGPGTVTFANATSAVTTATFSLAGNYVLRLTANDSALTGSADVTVNASAAPPVNVAPTVNAGANQTITLPASASLNGSATDDGLPNPPATLTYVWSKVSGPGTVSFAAAASANTTATFSAAGVYVLRLTANDSALSGSADVTITVNAVTLGNQAPLVNAGAAQAITLPATASLSAVVTDDGLPNPPGTVTLSWSKDSGPGNVIFANPNVAATTAMFAAAGNYVLRLSANDSALTGTATVAIAVTDGAPTLAAVADRTIQLGSRFQQVLVASDANINDTLSFALPTAPTGATLAPAPLIDWTPTAAQLGTHTFTATVTDTAGHSASTTFHVTVVHTNLPPQLGAQLNVILPVGTTFSRALTAIDPDAGDTLTFALVSGPSGMTLSGSALQWSTAGKAVGDYPVTVRVTDAGGLSDSKSFTITLQASAPPPVAVDDTYSTRLGQTLTIPARGVLNNDNSPSGGSLSATRLTDPDKGTISAFNANGGFTYQAPATPPGSVFTPVLRHNKELSVGGPLGHTIMLDLDGDGKPEMVFSGENHGVFAIHADTGNVLWEFRGSFFTGCTPYTGVRNLAAADIDDDGKPEVIFVGSCSGDNDVMRIVALNGQNGTIKWISPALAAIPVVGDSTYFASFAVPTIARLRTGESPSVLINVQAANAHRIGVVGFDTIVEPACRVIVESVPDGDYQPNPDFPPHYQQCRGVIVLNGTDGSVRQRMIAKKAPISGVDGGTEQTGLSAPVVVDLDGDGTPEIVAGGVVFNLNGTPRWQGASANILEVAVGNFDDSPDIEVVRFEEEPGRYQYLTVYKSDGRVLWRLPFDFVTFIGKIVVGDLDGDGKADIVFNYGGLLCAIKHDGTYRWCNVAAVVNEVLQVSSKTRVAIFDFDGDGVAEVVMQTNEAIYFLDGLSGKLKASFPITMASTGTTLPPTGNNSYITRAPLVGDVDADGHADLIFFWVAEDSISWRQTVLKAQNNDWRPARGVQNQFAYHVSNINDNGTIPTTVPLPNNFAVPRTNVFGTQAQTLAPVDPRKFTQTSFAYKVNDGTLDSSPATVKIDIAPVNRPPVFDSIPPTRYFQTYLPFSYTAHATDPDVGDTVTYRMVFYNYNGATCSIGATSGVLSCDVPINQPTAFFLIAATDSFGAETVQSIQMTGVTTNSTVPNVIGQTQAAAGTTLTNAGLAVGVVTLTANPAPAGQVIAQVPSAGTVALTGEAVALNVSSGPAPVIVPFVVGETLTLANTQLTTLNLTVIVTPAFSATIPVNQVMAQTPAAGTTIVPTPANPVTLTTSAGPPLSGTIAQIIVEPGTTTRLVGDNQQYKATAIFTDNTSADVTLAASWSSTVTAAATVNPVGLASAVASGGTTLRATVGATTGQTLLNVVSRVAGDSVLPVATITAPTAGSTVTGPTTVTGTATDANFLRYELAFAIAGDAAWTVIGEGTAPVVGGTLGSFDPTTLINDLYTIRLTVFDRGGNTTVALTTVQASGNMKIGLFTLGFQDLNIPLAGIPITVTRTYDSRDKSNGDFGIGWRLGLQTLRLRANRVPGTGWVRSTVGIVVSLAPTSEHKVSLTLGDGRVEEFDMVVSPTSNIGSLDATSVIGFAARPGTLGKLQVLGNTSLLILNGGLEDELVDDITLNTYNPRLFRYTTLEGTQIDIDRGEGVKKITDRNGNSLTFGSSGIIHSTGRSVTFTRDLQNRITQITDPLGNVQSYTYDGNGDLISHTNALGSVSRYKYNRNHGLIDILDPSGNHAVRNDYDANGRLISTTDANGNQITFTHNVSAQEELITDRRGNVTRALYDARGNVLSSEKGVTINGVLVNTVTTTTYDAQNNETSRVDPDGLNTTGSYSGVLQLSRVVDPAGLNLRTTFAYNARNDVTTTMDPGGRVYTFSYDASGNTTGLAIPGRGAATLLSDARGLPISSGDVLGNKTILTRDALGNITREEIFDAAMNGLRRIDFSYDSNGNKLSETLYRTIDGVLTPLTTQYAYDAANRLIAITDALGGIARAEYDAAGLTTAQVDPLGRRTRHAYDALGRRVATTYPDGTFDTLTYDVEGNVATQTDIAGRTTTFIYDELNRNIRVTLPDGSFRQTIYSPGGLVTANVDANGNRTDYAYDAAARRTATTLPPVQNSVAGPMVRPQLTAALNAAGLPVSSTDALGRQTAFQFDGAGQPTRTTFADGSTLTLTYDALGRRTSIVNEENQSTSFTYDGLGRIATVSGLAGDAAYTYDEAGNVLTRTDALGRLTRMKYDALNRLIKRQYPGGELESSSYDAVGNLVFEADPNGRTISVNYDAMNRPLQKNLPGAVTVAYSYKADGQRASVTDSRGVTTYSYDTLGRLSGLTHPTGETVSYIHDANGNLVSLQSPAATVGYSYDAHDRLTQVAAPEGQGRYYYDLAGNRTRLAAGNGVDTDYAYESRNRPTLVSHKFGTTTLQSFGNVYSLSGRRMQTTEQGGAQVSYGYDAKGRLTSEARSGATPFTMAHAYDAVGNRSATTTNGSTTVFAYNSNDQLTSDGAAAYVYDANGNLISKSGGPTTQYAYDGENRMIGMLDASGTTQHVYDADGNRVRTITPGGVTRYLVDIANNTGLSQVLEERDGTNTLQARYTLGNDLLAMQRGTTASFYQRDAHGNMRVLTSSAGAVTDSYVFDGYGRTMNQTGSTINPYLYSGERIDSGSGLYHLRARYYNPAQGRFITRDPFAGEPETPVSLHRYLYADADPVNKADPTGLESLAELSFTQAVQNSLKGLDFAVKANVVCNSVEKVQIVNGIIFWGTLSASALSEAVLSQWLPGKVGFSVVAFSPAQLQLSKAIKKFEMRAEVDKSAEIGLKFAIDYHNSRREDVTFKLLSGGGLSVNGAVGNNLDFPISVRCGIETSKATLKVRAKASGTAAPKLDAGFGLSVSAELSLLLGILRYEYPLFDYSRTLQKGAQFKGPGK